MNEPASQPDNDSVDDAATVDTVHDVDTVEDDALMDVIEVGCSRPASGEVRGIIVWCHGLGGSRHSGAGVAPGWGRQGYAVVTPTFADSISLVATRHTELGLDPAGTGQRPWAHDERVRAFMLANMLDWPWRRDRIATLGAVIDALPALMGRETGRAGPADRPRLGVGGHSFGAYVTQLVAGARIDCPLGPAMSFRDERVDAVVIASGQGRRQAGLRDGSWDDVDIPLLNITGTRDRGATTDDPAWKCEPFQLSAPGGRYQLVIDDADHGLGGVGGTTELFPPVADHLRLVEQITSRFWAAFIAGDPSARAWLDSDEPARHFGAAAVYGRR